MTMYWIELAMLSTIIIGCDYWFYRQMKKHHFYNWFINLSLLPGILLILVFLYIRFGFRYNHNYVVASGVQWTFYIFALIYIPKSIYIFFSYLNKLINRLFGLSWRVIERIGFILSILMVGVMGYGNIVTRDNLELIKREIPVKNLPPAFDGYKIAVFADFHIGNWNNRYRIMNPLIDLINREDPDIIVFAGDMVNNFSNELKGWEPYFWQLKSKQGNFAVLGNHDYGDYTNWKHASDKAQNLAEIKEHIRQLGFKLLLNENEQLIKGADTITLVGVENWSKQKHFHQYGNLSKALEGTDSARPKILISHDPMHWDAEVVGRKDIFLTIAGHTHAGQMGIINRCARISPARIIFKQWEGLYKKDTQYLYVNRGIGYVGIPMRIGIRPEITILELKKR